VPRRKDPRVGERIRELRELLGISQAELARAAPYGQQSQLVAVELHGSIPGIGPARNMAQRLGTTVEYLLYGDGPPEAVLRARQSAGELVAGGLAPVMTLSPTADDPPALAELADLVMGLGAPLKPMEAAWLRAMPGSPTTHDYQSALRAWRSGAARAVAVAEPRHNPLAAAPLPLVLFPPESAIQERAPKRSSAAPPRKKAK